MSEEFAPTPYMRTPVMDVASGIALGIALISALPKAAPEDIRKSVRKVRTSVIALQSAWEAAGGPQGPTDKRPADRAIDTGWGGLYGRLDNYASLPEKRWPKAARAAELRDIVFPDGLGFLTLPYNAEGSESEKRIKRIDDQKLGAEIDEIAGPEFLAEVRQSHADYGVALNITKAQGGSNAAGLIDPLRNLARAIGSYALKLAAIANDSEASLRMVRDALRPIDEHRAQAARRTSGTGDEPQTEAPAGSPAVTPATPVPDVPS